MKCSPSLGDKVIVDQKRCRTPLIYTKTGTGRAHVETTCQSVGLSQRQKLRSDRWMFIDMMAFSYESGFNILAMMPGFSPNTLQEWFLELCRWHRLNDIAMLKYFGKYCGRVQKVQKDGHTRVDELCKASNQQLFISQENKEDIPFLKMLRRGTLDITEELSGSWPLWGKLNGRRHCYGSWFPRVIKEGFEKLEATWRHLILRARFHNCHNIH